MRTFLLTLVLSTSALPAVAQTQAGCTANDGQYLSGTVTRKPYLVEASEITQSIQLSHTHLTIKSDADDKSYDVAIDDVFDPTWEKNSSKIPSNLRHIVLKTHLSLCSLLYTEGGLGIHWVYDSCGDTSPSNPNGWTEVVGNGNPGVNLENSETYCYLFN